MSDKSTERRWLKYGTLLSFGVGMIIGIVAGNPLLAVGTGVILAIIVQRLVKASEERKANSNEDSPS